jgi:hypothetical protein
VIDEERVLEHLGHQLTAAVYANINVAIECLDCFEIVWDNGK